jgi:hypothetical protein
VVVLGVVDEVAGAAVAVGRPDVGYPRRDDDRRYAGAQHIEREAIAVVVRVGHVAGWNGRGGATWS